MLRQKQSFRSNKYRGIVTAGTNTAVPAGTVLLDQEERQEAYHFCTSWFNGVTRGILMLS